MAGGELIRGRFCGDPSLAAHRPARPLAHLAAAGRAGTIARGLPPDSPPILLVSPAHRPLAGITCRPPATKMHHLARRRGGEPPDRTRSDGRAAEAASGGLPAG